MAKKKDDTGRDKKTGQFTEGNSGKPKGAISKRTAIWHEIGDWFANEGLELYQKNLVGMLQSNNPVKAAEGMKHYQALLEYFKPKLSRSESKLDHSGGVPITITKNYKKGD